MTLLPTNDLKYLEERFGNDSPTISTDSNMTCLVFHNYPLPSGFNHEKSDLLLRFQPGYPDIPPDMWWFDPPLSRADGQTIPATEVTEQHLNRVWQRWSRHLSNGQWQSGIDGIESYLALLSKELERSSPVSTQ